MPQKCSKCSLTFDSKNEYSLHQKRCVGGKETITFFFKETNQMITVKQNDQGLFDCFCSHNGCPGKKGFTTMEVLKKHMCKLKTTWLGQEQKGAGHSNLTPTHPAEPTNQAAEDTCIQICALISAKKCVSSLQQAMTSRGAAQNEVRRHCRGDPVTEGRVDRAEDEGDRVDKVDRVEGKGGQGRREGKGQTKAWGEHATVNVSVLDRQRHGESMPLSMCLSRTDEGIGEGQKKVWGDHVTINLSVQDRHGHDEEHATVNVSLQDRQGHGGEHGTT
ncbi:hypothetical protein EDC04DRAFT_2604200 [Pisolithus marmoratus]|nr:hypothetical protein EDC04DRAFT_2604200 [Pisolithus marmoratus]